MRMRTNNADRELGEDRGHAPDLRVRRRVRVRGPTARDRVLERVRSRGLCECRSAVCGNRQAVLGRRRCRPGLVVVEAVVAVAVLGCFAARGVVLASMNMWNNVVNAWWPLVFYPATDAPAFTKGLWAMIGTALATLAVTWLVWYLERRENRAGMQEYSEKSESDGKL